jgi:hypothetical protein
VTERRRRSVGLDQRVAVPQAILAELSSGHPRLVASHFRKTCRPVLSRRLFPQNASFEGLQCCDVVTALISLMVLRFPWCDSALEKRPGCDNYLIVFARKMRDVTSVTRFWRQRREASDLGGECHSSPSKIFGVST